MITLLLSIIYLAFISLGLPDSLLGAGWPVISQNLNVPISYAGIVSMIIAACTIFSSLISNKITHKIGVGLVTVISVGLTAGALLGTSIAPNFLSICLWSIPYGLGAGGVDAALNNYVALHFKARHMSWLHCFWGIGASISPYIMGYCLLNNNDWRGGYSTVSFIQFCLFVFILVALPVLIKTNKKNVQTNHLDSTNNHYVSIKDALKIQGVPFILISFFSYCALETTAGLWATTYLNTYRGIDADIAARFASLFYLGITFGRFINGFLAEKIGDKRTIRGSIIILGIGVVMIMIPLSSDLLSLAGLIVVGLGCAPIYPSIIHSTPYNFGKENSQAIVGIQMASAYTGSTFMPLIFGLLVPHISVSIYPFYLFIFVIIMLVSSELLNKSVEKNKK